MAVAEICSWLDKGMLSCTDDSPLTLTARAYANMLASAMPGGARYFIVARRLWFSGTVGLTLKSYDDIE